MSSWFALTDVGQARNQNQDEALARELPGGRLLLAVADGVGGAPGGEVASREAMGVIIAEMSQAGAEGMEAAIAAANERVMALQKSQPAWKNMATTLVLGVVEGGAARVANLGDSRAYARTGGELHQLSADDSWVAEAVASGELQPEQAALHPWRNVVTRGLGVHEVPQPRFYDVQLAEGDALLLSTDGLFRMLTDDEIGRILGVAGDAELAAHALVEAANAAGGHDNIGVAIYIA